MKYENFEAAEKLVAIIRDLKERLELYEDDWRIDITSNRCGTRFREYSITKAITTGEYYKQAEALMLLITTDLRRRISEHEEKLLQL